MLHKRKVLDARGIARAVPAPRPPITTDTRTEDERQLDEMRAAFHGVPYGLWVRAAVGLIGGAVIGYGLYDLAREDVGPQDQMAAIVVSAIAGSLTAFGFFRLGVKTPNVYKVAHLLAHCRLCLCCGYDLSGSNPASDGCTVCPECGAAWRLGEQPGTPGQTGLSPMRSQSSQHDAEPQE